ncbi:MAG: hypothetical protein LBI03_07920 [Clostridiales bacterium]|jgi:hypothetical protein|nr:hypothetical protein [Clostridiales bacterium]
MKKLTTGILILFLAVATTACSSFHGSDEAKKGKSSPIGFGNTATATFETKNVDEKENVTISVDEVIRGDEAFNLLKSKMSGMWTVAEQKDPYEYAIAKITFTLNSYENKDGSTTKKAHTFYPTSSEGKRYPGLLLGSMWYNDKDFPQLTNHEFSVGETFTGYEVLVVDKNESKPMLTYRNFLQDGSDGLWFNLYR